MMPLPECARGNGHETESLVLYARAAEKRSAPAYRLLGRTRCMREVRELLIQRDSVVS